MSSVRRMQCASRRHMGRGRGDCELNHKTFSPGRVDAALLTKWTERSQRSVGVVFEATPAHASFMILVEVGYLSPTDRPRRHNCWKLFVNLWKPPRHQSLQRERIFGIFVEEPIFQFRFGLRFLKAFHRQLQKPLREPGGDFRWPEKLDCGEKPYSWSPFFFLFWTGVLKFPVNLIIPVGGGFVYRKASFFGAILIWFFLSLWVCELNHEGHFRVPLIRHLTHLEKKQKRVFRQ